MTTAHTPKASIIMPAYNAQDTLDAALDAALGQTLGDIEVVVVDDGSTDQTPRILEKRAAADARLKVVTTQNHGQGAARNQAIALAQGDYVFFLDADDYIAPDTIEALTDQLEVTGADFVVFPYCYFEDDPECCSEPVWDYFPTSGTFEGIEIAPVLEDNAYFTCSRAYRRDFLQANGIRFGEGHIYEDVPFFVHAVLSATRACVVREPVYRVRFAGDSGTRSGQATERNAHDSQMATRACVELFSQHTNKPGIEVFRYHYARFAVRKFRRYYFERVPHAMRRDYAADFLACMHDLGPFEVLKSSDSYLTYCIDHGILEHQKLALFRALNFVLQKLRPVRPRKN